MPAPAQLVVQSHNTHERLGSEIHRPAAVSVDVCTISRVFTPLANFASSLRLCLHSYDLVLPPWTVEPPVVLTTAVTLFALKNRLLVAFFLMMSNYATAYTESLIFVYRVFDQGVVFLDVLLAVTLTLVHTVALVSIGETIVAGI